MPNVPYHFYNFLLSGIFCPMSSYLLLSCRVLKSLHQYNTYQLVIFFLDTLMDPYFFFWCNYLKREKSRENKKFNLVFSLQNGFGVFFRVTVFITSGEEAGVVGGDLSVVWIFLK